MTAVTEVPGVNSAIQHLQELWERMKTCEFSFKEADVEMIDNVTQAIKELDAERVHKHTLLETETIKASVLRHRLQFLPVNIQTEMTEAVESARRSNTEELKTLNDKLKTLNEEIEFLQDTKKRLIKENAILHPERDLVRSQHEEVITNLNQRMADKASKQIELNETRDRLRDTNQKIVELETQILILKEDMIQERADARQEKKRLKQGVHDTTKKTKKQKESNISKKKELDKLYEQLKNSEHELAEIRKSIRRFETSKARFDAQEKSFQAQLDKESRENKILEDKGFLLGQTLLQMEEKHTNKELELKTNLKDLEIQKCEANIEYDKLIDAWTKSKREINEAMSLREVDGSKVGELDKVLQSKKRELSKKAGDTARMKQENDEMEYRMKQLEENHQVTVQLLNKSIADYRDALSKERNERFELQEKRAILTREIDDFKMSFTKYVNELNKRVATAKQNHVHMSNEGAKLKIDTRTADNKIMSLQGERKQTQKNFEEMKTGLKNSIASLQSNIKTLEKSADKKKVEIEDKTPSYDALESLYVETLEKFEKTKKRIVHLKNQKTSLLEQTSRTKKEIAKLTNPSVLMQQELKRKRKEALVKMREETQELAVIEEKIYHGGRKLGAVIEENEKFKLSIEQMQGEIEALLGQKELNTRLQEALQHELLSQRGKLESGWVEDREMQSVFADRDRIILEDITEMRNRTEERENKVADITEKLDGELVLLTAFLENVSHRRPHESDSRPSTNSSSRHPPTVLQDYLESRTLLNTQKSRAEAISKVRGKMFEKKTDEEKELVEKSEDNQEEAEAVLEEGHADMIDSELRWAEPSNETPATLGLTTLS